MNTLQSYAEFSHYTILRVVCSDGYIIASQIQLQSTLSVRQMT